MIVLLLLIFILGTLLTSFGVLIAIGILLEGPPWLNRDFKNRYPMAGLSLIIGLILLFMSRSL
mgnify:CR=1 FL=1